MHTESPRQSKGIGELHISERRFQRVFRANPMPMSISTVDDGRLIDVNDAFTETLGFERDEVIGKTTLELGLFPDPQHRAIARDKFKRDGFLKNFEVDIRTSSGEIRTGLFSMEDISSSTDKCWLTMMVDISLLKEAYNELEFHSLVLCNIHDMVTGTDMDGRINYVNDAVCRMIGKSRDQLLGQRVEILGENTEHGASQQEIVEQTRLNGIWQGEVVNIDAEGREVFLSCRTRLIHDSRGNPVGMIGVATDISERKQREREIESIARFPKEDPNPVIRIMSGGELVYKNAAAASLIGAIVDSDSGLLKDRWLDLISSVIESNEAEVVEERCGGRVFSVSVAPVKEFDYVNLYARDITEKMQIELELQQSRKLDSIGQLAGGVAHDFNNTIMGVMGYIEMCRDAVGQDSPLNEWLEEIHRSMLKSSDLTRQLLAFARKQSIAPEVLNINDSVEETLKMMQRLIGENIDLTWRPGSDLWLVRMDPGQIDQILANLCVNARDAICESGSLEIMTANAGIDSDFVAANPSSREGDFVELTVRDDGCGIDEEVRGHIFEPFFTTKEVGQGTGLGLSTVYGIVKQNDGFILLDSAPGEGATFRIYLPRHVGGDGDSDPDSEDVRIRGGEETLMLVEDEKSIRVTTAALLRNMGYKVLEASGPYEAIEISTDYDGCIDLLLSDVIMPGMNGRRLSRSLACKRPEMKVCFISGYSADVLGEHGVLEEGVGFIPKPIGRSELAIRVRELLDQ